MFLDVGIAFSAGVLSFLSPCFLPLIPAYLVYLGGRQANAVVNERSARRAVFVNALAFILGFGTIFIALGVAITFVGLAFQQGLPTMRLVGGGLLVVFGLSFLGLLRIPWLQQILQREVSLRNTPLGRIDTEKTGPVTSFLIGLVFGTGWTPCVGPILGAILIQASASETVLYGGGLLAIYTLGMGIPFLAIAAAVDRAAPMLKWLRSHMQIVERVSGVFLILMGIAVATNFLAMISGLLAFYSLEMWAFQ
jgi:cytochrome c-type biogenesis protein